MKAVGLLRVRDGLLESYGDVLTPAALETVAALAPFDADRRGLMRARIERRARRQRDHERIGFLPADATIGRTNITVSDARAGHFDGGTIPHDLERQWIQGTGPAARPRARTAESIRSVAYALLSGADGWMFDGEDALGQVDSMSLDNQRNLKLAFERADVFMHVAEQVAGEMNAWATHVPAAPDRPGLAGAAGFHDPDLSPARPPPRRSARAARQWRVPVGLHRRPGALRRQSRRAAP